MTTPTITSADRERARAWLTGEDIAYETPTQDSLAAEFAAVREGALRQMMREVLDLHAAEGGWLDLTLFVGRVEALITKGGG